MRYLGLCAAAAVLLVGGAARAQQVDDQTKDIRCVVIMGGMIGNPQFAQLKDSATAGLFYFLGRADSRQPTADLGPQFKRVREELPITQYEDEGRRCFAALKKKNDQLKAIQSADAPPAKH
jgi:hypothetical protein